jgi:hypothetical protein
MKVRCLVQFIMIVLIISLLISGCGNPYTSKEANEYLNQSFKPYSNFMDKYMLADSTPRMSLIPVITDMQNYKIEYSEIETPKKFDDLEEAKGLCIQGMENAIQGFIAFQTQEDDDKVMSYFQASNHNFNTMEEILIDYEDGNLFIDDRHDTFGNQASEVIDTTPKLQLLNYDSDTTSNYIIIEGQVKNVSGEKLENVEAVVEFYDENDNFIKSDSALIEYDVLLPDQTSPFKVMTITNPEISRYKVSFKDFMGGVIDHKE